MARSRPTSLGPDDLPPGLEVLSTLSTSERGEVLEVRRGDEHLVLRVEAGSGPARPGWSAHLEAQGLLRPVDSGHTPGGRPWVLRPFVEGGPFHEAVVGQPVEVVEAWVASLLETLATLHEAGLVHRDVKSENVIVGADGPVLVDLDLLAEAEGNEGGAGSRFHLAPEVLLGQPVTPAADLFSLGAMIAIALCGSVDEGFTRHFPAQSFWSASGLEPGPIPGELGTLVRQLVRRNPGDRPASARRAASLLGGGAGGLPPLGLSFVGGRDTALKRLLSALEPQAGARLAVLVSVADPEERHALVDTLQLGLTVAGRRVLRERIDDLAPGSIDRIGDCESECVLVDAPSLAEGATPALLAELVAAYLSATRHGDGVLGLVVDEDLASRVSDGLATRVLDEELALLRSQPWPRVPVAALARHLDRLTGSASPEVARRLAASLHRLTIGRRSDLDRALSRAVEVGVLRPEPQRYTLLLDHWPADDGAFGEAVSLESAGVEEHDVALLLGLDACCWPPSPRELAQVAGLDEHELPERLAGLERLGVVRRPHGPWGPVVVIDGRWTHAAREARPPAERRAAAERALERAQARGADGEVLARQRLALVSGPDDLRAVLDAAAELLDRGRLGAARGLVQAALPLCEPELEARRRLLEARIELAQGDALRALATLQELFGDELAGADHATLAVAAHAAEQAGQRRLSRALNERILAGEPERVVRLRAIVGLGYALLLDGKLDEAAACCAEGPRDDDDDHAAAALLSLSAIILGRQGLPEADARFAEAVARAQRADDPLLLARAELNRAQHDRRQGRSVAAQAALERAEQAFGRAGHVHGRAVALNNLGVLERDRGELTRCRERLREALALRRRIGDAHGAASSLGSLAAAELEAGHVGVALELLTRARRLFASGDYQRELAFLDVHEALALALAGRHREAAERLGDAGLELQRKENPALVARAEATLQFLGSDRARAIAAAHAALDRARAQDDGAELFRCAALLASVEPGESDAGRAMQEAAERLDAPVRRAEAAWRASAGEPVVDTEALSAWLEVFETAGRTDLAAAVALLLAEGLDRGGDRAGRRVARARAGQAADALADGLPPTEREAVIERIARLSGPRPSELARGRQLDTDWLLACNRRMANEERLEELLLAIVDMALELTGSRRGFLVLLEGDEVAVHVARNIGRRDMAPDEARFSRTLAREAVREGRPVMTSDAGSDARFAGAQSISSFRLRSVLCVPLPGVPGGGALYLDDDQREAAFDQTDVERVGALADQAAVAIGQLRRRAEIEALNARLAQRVAYTEDELDKARSALRRQGKVPPLAGMVGDAESMRRVFELVDRVAPTTLSVLVTGPSGSGKDLVSRALHERSERASGPLIIENVAAVPANLLESEMFGHARGAFTGADRDRPGLFAQADGGTFVLDEIGELPLELQPKLLRVLESGEFRPVGARSVQTVDVRIVAATNRDLLERVRAGEFREDLYYRLNAVEIRLPGLEERLGDIPLLVANALDGLNAKHGTRKSVADPVMTAFVRRAWPGQVRELLNEVSRLYFLCDDVLDRVDLVRDPPADLGGESAEAMPRSLRLDDLERAAIDRALRAADGKKEQAARLLGISRAGLYAKLRRLEAGEGAGDD